MVVKIQSLEIFDLIFIFCVLSLFSRTIRSIKKKKKRNGFEAKYPVYSSLKTEFSVKTSCTSSVSTAVFFHMEWVDSHSTILNLGGDHVSVFCHSCCNELCICQTHCIDTCPHSCLHWNRSYQLYTQCVLELNIALLPVNIIEKGKTTVVLVTNPAILFHLSALFLSICWR